MVEYVFRLLVVVFFPNTITVIGLLAVNNTGNKLLFAKQTATKTPHYKQSVTKTTKKQRRTRQKLKMRGTN